MKLRPTLTVLLGIALSALFLWLALRNVDFAALRAALARADLVWVVPLLVLLAGFCVAKAWRWAMLLDLPLRTALAPLVHAVLVGYAATSLLPLQLGEVVRAWAAARAVERPAAVVIVSIALERILDLFAVLLVLGAVLLAGGPLPVGLLRTGYVMAAGAVLLLAALVVYVGWTEQCLRWTARVIRFLPRGFQDKVLAQLRAGAVGAVTLKRPSAWAPLLISSIAQWGLMCGCIAVSCMALGLQTPPPAYAAVLGLTIVGMSLPSGPGYVGSIQLAFSLALAPFGVSTADAIAASLFYHVLVCGSLTLAGVASLYRLGGRWRAVARLEASS
jgi:uncharacterized protein (TIRG00374 family)